MLHALIPVLFSGAIVGAIAFWTYESAHQRAIGRERLARMEERHRAEEEAERKVIANAINEFVLASAARTGPAGWQEVGRRVFANGQCWPLRPDEPRTVYAVKVGFGETEYGFFCQNADGSLFVVESALFVADAEGKVRRLVNMIDDLRAYDALAGVPQ